MGALLRSVIVVSVLLPGSIPLACTVDATYTARDLEAVVEQSSAVFIGKVTQIIYQSEQDLRIPDEDGLVDIEVTAARDEPRVYSDIVVVDVVERFKGSRQRYVVEIQMLCGSLDYESEQLYFLKQGVSEEFPSNVYSPIAIEPASQEWRARLRTHFDAGP